MSNVVEQGFEDAFGKLIADGTTNEIDIASHYPYSPQRWRFLLNGSRKFIQYNSVSKYNHATDVHELSPAANDTIKFETAERSRYVVQYEQEATFAFSINQALQSGDIVRVGYFDDNDGWYMEHNDTHSSTQVDLVIRRNGTDKKTRSNLSLTSALTDFTRLSVRFNWYNVGRALWQQTTTSSNEQKRDTIGSISIDDGTRGPQVGNLPLRYEVTAGSGTSSLKLNAGSIALVTLGAVSGIKKNKISTHTINIDTTGSWIPILALRVDPDRDIINAQLTQMQILEYGSSDDVELLALSHDSSKVKDSGGNALVDSDFSVPNKQSAQDSVFQTATAVEKAPDSSGTVGTSASNPGGYQIAHASLYTSGEGSTQTQRTADRDVKQQILGRDTVVIWGKSGTTGDVTFELTTEQDW